MNKTGPSIYDSWMCQTEDTFAADIHQMKVLAPPVSYENQWFLKDENSARPIRSRRISHQENQDGSKERGQKDGEGKTEGMGVENLLNTRNGRKGCKQGVGRHIGTSLV